MRESPQEQFLLCARVAVPGIRDADIARRIGVTSAAICTRRFGARRAVEAWNASGAPPLRYVPASVGLW